MKKVTILISAVLLAVSCSLQENPDQGKTQYPFQSNYTDEIETCNLNGMYRMDEIGFGGTWCNSTGWPGDYNRYVLFEDNLPAALYVYAYIYTGNISGPNAPREEVFIKIADKVKDVLYMDAEGRDLYTNIVGICYPKHKEVDKWYLMHSDDNLLVLGTEPEATLGYVLTKIDDESLKSNLLQAEDGTAADASHFCWEIYEKLRRELQ